jgi:hypothetical protein
MTNQATDEQTCSLTDALGLHGIGLTAAAANKVLHSAGMIENRWRESSKPGRPPKQYRAATPLGEQHGIVNEASTLPTGDPVLVKYLPSMFPVLWNHPDVQETLAVMLKEGEVRMRDGDAAKSETFLVVEQRMPKSQ